MYSNIKNNVASVPRKDILNSKSLIRLLLTCDFLIRMVIYAV